MSYIRFTVLLALIVWLGLVYMSDPTDYLSQDTEGQEQQGKQGPDPRNVKAAMCALAAAAALFTPYFRWRNDSGPTDLLTHFGLVIGAVAAMMAGIYWVLSASQGQLNEYFTNIIYAAAFLTFLGVAMPVYSDIRNWVRQRKEKKEDGQSDGVDGASE
jgi:hypothetical protein